jgi:undecaprenyl diphosphate synthase
MMECSIGDGVMPNHLGIIMDGNGRWAQARGFPRVVGHRAGVQTIRRMVEICKGMGIHVLTLYAFSTENWKRPQAEVTFLMQLLEGYVTNELPELQSNGICLRFMGRQEGLPDSLLAPLHQAVWQTRHNDRMTLALAINYGGRAEIVDAARAIAHENQLGKLDGAALDESIIQRHLYCSDLPDADLVIRTGGEWRLSNFMLWRAAGAVFWSTPVLWPDFQREHLQEAIRFYQEQSCRNADAKSQL